MVDQIPRGIVRTEDSPADTGHHLRNAAQYAVDHHFEDFILVDVDCHHYEGNAFLEIAQYIDDEAIRRKLHLANGTDGGFIPKTIGDQALAGRIRRYGWRGRDPLDDSGLPHNIQLVHRYMDQMGIDYTVLFPGAMLSLGVTPMVEVEVELAKAYAKWVVEDVVPFSDRVLAFLYLPFNDAGAAADLVRQYKDHPGVAGFTTISVHRQAIHHREYLPMYQLIEESGKPLAFHSTFDWGYGRMLQLNKFISVHSLSFPFNNMVHLANYVFNGIPERFPGIKTLWIEGGLSYIPFMMQRFDNEYMMRSSEAPLLKKLPSEYMREFYWSSQPMERTANDDILAATFDYIHASTQLLYSSDYPHWDMDTPRSIYDLPFIDEATKRAILGGNSLRVFNIPAPRKRANPQPDYRSPVTLEH